MNNSDKLGIQELIARSNWAADTGDAMGWAATYVPNGVMDGLVGRLQGRQELVDYMTRLWDEPTASDWSATRGKQHWVANLVIEGADTHATAKSHFILFLPTSDGGRVLQMGYYEDKLTKLDGEWLFEERRIRAWPSEALSERIRREGPD